MIRKLLIANRGEIAIRIARAAGELGIATVAIHSVDDALSLHARAGDEAVEIAGTGPAAYLDGDAIIAAASASGCDAIHPGYGFLSENADFAARCATAGLIFVGPDAEALGRFGNKLSAKLLARGAGVPVLEGSDEGDVAAGQALLDAGCAVMVKGLAGGGGRGIRLVQPGEDIAAAIEACRAEMMLAFGEADVLIERHIARARHIEVQIVADGQGGVVALGERECSVQRRNQKIIEIAPAPALDAALRDRIEDAALRLMRSTPYRGLATVEFLVDADADPAGSTAFAFIEVNPRLQVEHTITEAVRGVDLVQAALRIAGGASLADLGLQAAPPARGTAIQLRVTAEVMGADGGILSSGGTLSAWEPPSGPGVRVDGFGYAGYAVNPRFDSLLAKLIVHAGTAEAARTRAVRALSDFRIEGAGTNLDLLAAMLTRPELLDGRADTRWFERVLPDLLAAPAVPMRHFMTQAHAPTAQTRVVPAGLVSLEAPLNGVLVSLSIAVGDMVHAGQEVGLVEALKMQHAIKASQSGLVRDVLVLPGVVLADGEPVAFLEPADVAQQSEDEATEIDLDAPRADLAEVMARHALTLDANRPDAVARRRKTGHRTARENLDDLFDADSFNEYGALTIAAQQRRRSIDDLMARTPADGLVGGTGTVNAAEFGPDAASIVGMSYDYTVLAGTQGYFNHLKTDRLLDLAHKQTLPVVFYVEGGGGRPGDVDKPGVSGLDTPSFARLAGLSGHVPRIAIAAGRCFAGNAVFFGSCDITIATRDSNIGMGGPAMIEGGGLGVFTPEEVGPSDVQWANGVIDILVDTEAEATAHAKHLLSFFQGRVSAVDHADQRLLRHVIPENRLRVFDVRRAIALLADTDSFVELRGGFAAGMITGLMRIDGRPVGLMANDNRILSGAIDSDGADKAARFMQLCDSFGFPIVSLCDTPGFMVGPEAEKSAPVRHGSRMFIIAASLKVPVFTVILRKGYGLGAQAMAGGSFISASFTIAWPTGEFGGMGLEGAVRLGFSKELAAIEDPAAQEARYRELVDMMYTRGKAVSVAQVLEIDAVIDPAETRDWIKRGLAASKPRKSGRFVDTW
ncbi:MAG: ATP-grasp domain-containing protein [Sphingomonadales bacterium]|nr:ATP-grasp domain-containing protein [Sphingomonadales bacterium]